ncbi:MAG: hypothetical protein ACJAWV_002164 [Flammeovirgaceae bacterium]
MKSEFDKIKITTPTFQLTPIEKPDMSSMLIHMTGKNELESILKGENFPEESELEKKQGFLKSGIPKYKSTGNNYNCPVVCFTESPTFALDFFRRRTSARFHSDQQYGIGFDKASLIKQGARPVVSLDRKAHNKMLKISSEVKKFNSQEESVLNKEVIDYLNFILDDIKPLLFPLLEDNDFQGFSWEREWRHSHSEGLPFNLHSVEVICCPNSEKESIQEILGTENKDIPIVESWKEYNEITEFLKNKKNIKIEDIKKIKELEKIIDINQQLVSSLEEYRSTFVSVVKQINEGPLDNSLEQLNEVIAGAKQKISLMKKAPAQKKK